MSDVAEAMNAGAADRRAAARRRVLLGGKIVFDQGARSLDCTIRDLSEKGARIRLSSPVPLPGLVHLIDMKRGVAFQARVARLDLPEIGLEFLGERKLSEAATPEEQTMRQLWLERVAR